MRFYIASGFANAKLVRAIADKLEARGFTFTYDWTQHHPDVNADRPSMTPAQIAMAELQGVIEADLVIAFLPNAAKGTHFELGVAAANGKEVLLMGFAEHLVPGFRYEPHPSDCVCVFYHLPGFEQIIIPDQFQQRPTVMPEVVLAHVMGWQVKQRKTAEALSHGS